MRRTRGQALLLMAFGVFLLALMVLLTLGFGWRTHERMELQIATDAAAYSQAVSTARTFNTIALLNRAQTSQMVALAGVQSLISWTGTYRANLAATHVPLYEIMGLYALCCAASVFGACDSCACSEIAKVEQGDQAISDAENKAKNNWDNLDKQAAQQAKAIRDAAARLKTIQEASYQSLVMDVLGNQRITKDILKQASPDLLTANGGEWKSKQEVTAAVKDPASVNHHSISATMGERNSTFVTARDNASWPISLAVTRAFGDSCQSCLVMATPWAGGSGFGQDREQSQTDNGISGDSAWGEDHGDPLMVLWVPDDGCFPLPGAGYASASHVRASTDDGTNEHNFGGDSDNDATIHSMGSCSGQNCPDMWPAFLDYNQDQVADASNFFGQPVLFAIGYRDLRNHARDPWNLSFSFRFSQGAEFDNSDPNGPLVGQTGFDSQVSLSAAIAYYHRPGHFQEPPNFFNPFWRATLWKPDDDAEQALRNAGFNTPADTVQLLKAQGFKGGL